MIPLRDIIPSRTTPFVTLCLIAVNAAAWVYELTLPERVLVEIIETYGVVPRALAPSTLVTSMFLHGSWLHIIGNMWYLWIFGDNVEDRMGHARFLAFYFVCGIGASAAHVYVDSLSVVPTIGASGAIAGVMGAYFVLYPQSRVLTLIPLIVFWEVIEIPAIFLLGFWFLMQLFSAGAVAVTASTGGGGVAFMAHVAGFVTGVLGVFVFRQRQRPEQYWA